MRPLSHTAAVVTVALSDEPLRAVALPCLFSYPHGVIGSGYSVDDFLSKSWEPAGCTGKDSAGLQSQLCYFLAL